MTTRPGNAPVYVCGHSPRELDRLERQGRFFAAITTRVLTSAGLAPGMRVLDIGCGAGDLSMLAAHIVGADGAVHGIDRVPAALAAARARAAQAPLPQVSFALSDVSADASDGEAYDAVIGRFVLMHQADPSAVLAAAARRARGGGLVVMIESHMQAAEGLTSQPPVPPYDRVMRWMLGVLRAAGAHADAGLALPAYFAAAGLAAPDTRLEARVSHGADNAETLRYTLDSVDSMRAAAAALALEPPDPDDVHWLEAHLAQPSAVDATLVSPLIAGAWCRVGDATHATKTARPVE